jgi:hypothetical protein
VSFSNLWCHADITKPVEAPLQILPYALTKERFLTVLNQFANQARYVKRDITGDDKAETFCNFFVREVLAAMGIYLPRLKANEIIEWLLGPEGIAGGWRKEQQEAARSMGAIGIPVITGFKNDAGPGHLALLVPPQRNEDSVPGKIWVAQAGKTNSNYMSLVAAFGTRPVTFFAKI